MDGPASGTALASGTFMVCPCCGERVLVARASGGTLALAPDGSRVDLLSSRCPHPRCAGLVFGVGARPQEAPTALLDAKHLRAWLVRALVWDLLRVLPLVAFVALFAIGPVAAVHATFGWHDTESTPVFIGALLAVLPEAILLIAIIHGLAGDVRRTRASYEEVLSGTSGGLHLRPEPQFSYRGY
jgi:hypothetical protein